MEKRLSADKAPDQEPVSYLSTTTLVLVGGFSLFWACFFAMLMRNAFLDADIERLAYHLVLRIAFFIGFGAAAAWLARTADGVTGRRTKRVMGVLVVVFAVIASASPAMYVALGQPLPAVFDIAVWAVSGVGLCCLLFLWLPVVARLDEAAAARSMALSAGCGGLIYLIVNLLPSLYGTGFLSLCALASLGVLYVVVAESRRSESEGEEGERGEVPIEGIPYATSKRNAGLSWSFGVIYVVYGIVFGLGAGSITQIAGGTLLFAGIAAFILIGGAAAWAFMRRFADRMRQIDVLRMLFPFLVVSLVTMALFTGPVYALSNLLLLASYVFLVAVSVAFEVQTARSRGASPLYVVGMSQSALSGGMAVGFGLGLLPSATGALDYGVLSAVALALVVLLAAFITFAPTREPVVEEQSEPESEEPHEGHWKARCAAVARDAGLSVRETEVFFLLAKGRGIEHIQNKLCISGHTVKTHTYNIYRKMGIGSREELLDAIEAATPDEATHTEKRA
ncbi:MULTISPECIES: helix-turn-helix domain-containing protein [Gordonibacter]|uniref:Helix-turn-helix transcriptional regulator n=2 Tax=Gordonibacter TaxID=644652 RepID=A0ABT7DQL2_9ACTN|nr:helix-turn-helix transcriptional regulator [Gordonibacter sp. KGMB12511]MDJ1651839.1 helix-turn-helix transcriptional regulator [Gordonibacter sp. KGMB12511]HIW75628.1 helix-turn-helix transcriptional regulator [Candidatus Gordonibacter avicola]